MPPSPPPMPEIPAEPDPQEQIEREVNRRMAEREAALREELGHQIREDIDREERLRYVAESQRAAEEAAREERERLAAVRKQESEREAMEAATRQAQEKYEETVSRLREEKARYERELAELEEKRRAAEEAAIPAPAAPSFAEPIPDAPEPLVPSALSFDFGEPEAEEEPEIPRADHKVQLIFAHPLDPNLCGVVDTILDESLSYLGKSDLGIETQTRIVSPTLMELNIRRFPVADQDDLVYLINVLGHSDLGIRRIILD